MSTYLYLQCDSHDPPLVSDGEVGQHLYDLPAIRTHIGNRRLYADMARHDVMLDAHGDHFAGTAFRFLTAHPKCAITIIDEYGRPHPITPPPEEAPYDEQP